LIYSSYEQGCDLYYGRQGVTDRNKAYEKFMDAAEAGVAEAQFMVAYMNERGVAVEPDIENAVTWYRRAAENGFRAAIYEVGRLHYQKGEYDEAVEFFREAVAAGEPKAKTFLGVAYKRGHGVEADPLKALELYREAADEGDIEAFRYLAECYEEGIGVKPDLSKMQRYLKRGCERGDGRACALLAERYYYGSIPCNDCERQSFRYYLESAKLGFPVALEWCGEVYAKGIGVSKDLSKALHWLQKAIEADMPRAKYLVAYLILTGELREEDRFDPYTLCREAAEAGDTEAQRLLGMMYRKGAYVSRDESKATMWMQRSAVTRRQ
jgi:TPR repeat protein